MERLLVRQQEVQHSRKRSGSAACMYTVVGGPKMISGWRRSSLTYKIASSVCVGLLIDLAALLNIKCTILS